MVPRGRAFCLLLAAFLFAASGSLWSSPFLRGDGNQDGKVDISDAVHTLLYLFTHEGPALQCKDAADANDSGAVEIADAVWTLSYLFAAGPPPPDPFPLCGHDGTDDDLACDAYDLRRCYGVGVIVTASGCKSFLDDPDNPRSQDCIFYEYDGARVLKLKHVNAGFNCCPGEISITVTMEEDTIAIREAEASAMCDCMCLFDLEIEIPGIPPGEYTIKVEGLYVQAPPDKQHQFPADLTAAASGSDCLERKYYPWG